MTKPPAAKTLFHVVLPKRVAVRREQRAAIVVGQACLLDRDFKRMLTASSRARDKLRNASCASSGIQMALARPRETVRPVEHSRADRS